MPDSPITNISDNLVGNVITAGESHRKCMNNLDSAITAFDEALLTQIADVVLRLASKPRGIPDKLADSFYKWLSPSYWELEEVRWRYDRARIPETLRWITTLPEFEAWRTGDNQPPHYNSLWLKGHQGVGKSMLAAFIIEVLERSYPDSAVLYFFCRNGESRLRDVRDIVTTLAYQLWRKFPERYDVESLSDGFFPERIKSPVLLAEHLLANQWPSVPELFLVLDGIDECQDSSGDSNSDQTGDDIGGLLSFLLNLPNLRLLVTSRPNQAIATVLESYSVKEIGFENNKDDVDRYILHQVQRSSILSKAFSLVDINPVTYLGPLARGNFMLARVVLSEARQARTISEFRNVFETRVPQELNQLYRKAIQRLQLAGRGKFAKEVLMWTLGSERPLTVQELQEAVELSLEDTHIDFKQLVQDILSSFVEISPSGSGIGTSTVRIIHDSIREFLSCPQLCDFFLDLSYVQSHLAQICMRHLSKPLQRNSKFTHYAALNWMEHLNRAPAEGLVTPDLFETFYKFFVRADGIEQWLREEVLRDEFDRFYDYDVHGVVIGLRSWMGRALSSTPNNPLSSAFEKLPEPMHNNIFECMTELTGDGTQGLHRFIGAILARLWVHVDFEDSEQIIRAFKMAWKCLQLSTQIISDEDDDTWKVSKKGGPQLSWKQPTSPGEIMNMSAEFGYDQTKATCVLNVAVVLEKYKFVSNLYDAAERGQWELVRLMIELGADVTATNTYSWALFCRAVHDGNLEVMKCLVEHGVDDKAIGINGWSALDTAVSRGKLEVVNWLVQERGANITGTRYGGQTVLHIAAKAGQLEVAKWLVEHGQADCTVKDKDGRTVLRAASDAGHWGVVNWLVSRRADFPANEVQRVLYAAVRTGQLEVIKWLVQEHGAKLTVTRYDKMTILHIAAQAGQLEVVKWLVERGHADVTAKDLGGRTVLLTASDSGHWDVVKWLVASCKGIAAFAANEIQTVLHAAAIRHQFEVVKGLVEHGADATAQSEDGRTILHIAAAMGDVDVVRWLVKKNVDVTAVNKDGETALQIASKNRIGGNFREIVKLLGG